MSNRPRGTLTFLPDGQTQAWETRHFQVYLGSSASGRRRQGPAWVRVTGGIIHQGQESFRIETPTATYYYHQEGAGFSGLVDGEERDWIGYSPQKGSAGEYRGIPNLVFRRPGNGPHFFHPGSRTAHSRLRQQGPIKVSLYSEAKPEHAKRWVCL